MVMEIIQARHVLGNDEALTAVRTVCGLKSIFPVEMRFLL